ncbi:hypothetical protein [Pseudanabaena sp. BC1403]|uniref:hypothetical protein n=1 Tax=Pseudanabaena sp. BC1403 TaxID=2043171 RepID=UPI001CA49949|nr:hypothetical protein [Pseudanabaena sp. BC1403]
MMLINEEELVSSKRGKWSTAGIPHKGWVCIDIEDLGEPVIECEMCESQKIRFVHYMKHPEYQNGDGLLQVGCICAGHMEGDLSASHAREASMKSRASKRKRWTSRAWKISSNGNPFINADGYRTTIYRRADGWAWTVADHLTVSHARRNFKTRDEAKLAAFDHMTKLLS